MAASASDVRDILSLPHQTTPALKPRKSTLQSARKPEGITRELFSLIGDAAPSLAAQYAKPRFKQKPDLGKGKVKWEWRQFTNGARKDSLKLSHWVKASVETPADYPFAKYNTCNPVMTYTEEEYRQELEDPEWSKEETDYLFSLVREFDMRFIVVADRYEFPEGSVRSMEDIKWRYYTVCRKLIQSRPWAGDEASRTQLLQSYQFDKERETARKARVLTLLNRTPQQIAEEESLYLEIKRLEQTERRFAKERDELLLTLGGIQSGLAGIRVDDDAMPGIFNEPNKKKKRGRAGTEASELDSPVASTSISISLNGPKKLNSAKQAAFDVANCITRTELAGVPASTKSAHQPVFLRSQKFPDPKPTVASRATIILKELGILISRLVMPTTENLQAMEVLQKTAGSLVELKRTVDRVDQEIRVLKERLGLTDHDAEQDGDVEMTSGVQGGDADAEGTADGEDTPMPPPAPPSARSRSSQARRTQHKRSISISSADSSATAVHTRAGSVKRQRNV